jgi:hypothetical protein
MLKAEELESEVHQHDGGTDRLAYSGKLSLHVAGWLSPPSTCIPAGLPAYWMVLPTFRVGLSFSVVVPYASCLWKPPHRHTQKCALLMFYVYLNLIKLSVKFDNHNLGMVV